MILTTYIRPSWDDPPSRGDLGLDVTPMTSVPMVGFFGQQKSNPTRIREGGDFGILFLGGASWKT